LSLIGPEELFIANKCDWYLISIFYTFLCDPFSLFIW